MNVSSNCERLWRRFPELQRHCQNAQFPTSLFHHSGIRSPYTTILDDMHDLAEIAVLVEAGRESMARALVKGAAESPDEHLQRLNKTLVELENLGFGVKAFADGFLKERRDALDEIRRTVSRLVLQVESVAHKE